MAELFFDSRLTVIQDHIQVVEVVVDFGVDTVVKGVGVGESFEEIVEEGLDFFWIIVGKAEQDHDLANGADAQHEISHETGVVARIPKAEAMLYGQLFGGDSNLVGGFGLKPAVLDVDGFIEGTGFMKAEDILLVGNFAVDFFFREPAPVGEGEFEFIAIVGIGVGPQYGLELEDIEFTDSEEGIFYEELFVGKLAVVVEMLPAASATNLEVITEGLYALRRVGDKVLDDAFEETFLFSEGKYVDDIPGDGIFDKKDSAVWVTAHAPAFFCYSRDADLFSDKLFGCHN